MSIIVGLILVFGSITLGFLMSGGNLLVLMQVNEFIIIGGAALGALIISSSLGHVMLLLKELLGLLGPNPCRRETYTELLQVLYEIFYAGRREGLVGIEKHVEDPENSEIFTRHTDFLSRHHAVSFLSDTLKVLLAGAVEEHHLSEILELDLERHHHETLATAKSLQTTGDALPGFGIVAAVLGVVITMGHIGGSPAEIGEHIGAALVGTLVGILLAYGVANPLAEALKHRAGGHSTYLNCIRIGILSFARGDSPITSVEFARRAIEPEERPTFEDVEELTQRRPSGDDEIKDAA